MVYSSTSSSVQATWSGRWAWISGILSGGGNRGSLKNSRIHWQQILREVSQKPNAVLIVRPCDNLGMMVIHADRSKCIARYKHSKRIGLHTFWLEGMTDSSAQTLLHLYSYNGLSDPCFLLASSNTTSMGISTLVLTLAKFGYLLAFEL